MSTTNSIPIRSNKKRTLNPRIFFNIDCTVDNLEKIATITLIPKVENTFEVLGKSVAVQLNHFPKRKTLASQFKIQTILTEELLKNEEILNQVINKIKFIITHTLESRQSSYKEG